MISYSPGVKSHKITHPASSFNQYILNQMKRLFIIILLAALGIGNICNAAKTPAQYQAVEKELKKQYKDVTFEDKYFIVQDPKTKNYAAATLDGKVFTPFKVSQYSKNSGFKLLSLGGQEYLFVDFLMENNLYSLDGELLLEKIRDAEGMDLFGKQYVQVHYYNEADNALYDSSMRKLFTYGTGEIRPTVINGEDFLLIVDPKNSSSTASPRNKLYTTDGHLLYENFQTIIGDTSGGENLISIKLPDELTLYFTYNPVSKTLIPVINAGNKICVVNGKECYIHKGNLYDISGKQIKLKGEIVNVTEAPGIMIIRDKAGLYGAIDTNLSEITPVKWNYLKCIEKGNYLWFEATLTDRSLNTYKQKHPDQFITHVLDCNGIAYPLAKSVVQESYNDRATQISGNKLMSRSNRMLKEIPGADLKNFAYNPTSGRPGSPTDNVQKPSAKIQKDFPSLEIAEGSLQFVDRSGRNAINAEETYAIEFDVTNSGKGAALDCSPSISIRSGSQGIKIGAVKKISIAPGKTLKVTVPVEASMNVMEGTAEFAVKVDEPNGFGTSESLLSVTTHAYEAPHVVVNDYTVTSPNGSATLQKKTPFILQLLVQNVAYGRADDVSVTLHVPQNVFIIEGEDKTRFNVLNGGQTQDLVYTLIANNNYEGESIPIQVEVREKHNKYAENRQINLQMDQPMTASRIVVDETDSAPRNEITVARLNSDVDVDIPTSRQQADNTFVVVIANENYSQVAPVPFAVNDGNIFAKYCQTTLGVPERNIRTVTNGTLNEIKRNIDWLCQVGKTFGDKANLILYYSGHGIPDESTGQAYLMPIDGYHYDMGTNIAVSELYKTLGSSGADRIIVFMDACFSGARRGEGMLMAARGVQLKAKTASPQNNMIVFSAAQGDETAYPYDKQNHGLFTYFLLKKLKETGGKVTLGELTDYVSDEVKKVSLLENSKIQTPQVQISPKISGSWRELDLTR